MLALLMSVSGALQVPVLQVASPSSRCDHQNHFCTFLNTIAEPQPSLKWTMALPLCGPHGHSGHTSGSPQVHPAASRKEASIKGHQCLQHWQKVFEHRMTEQWTLLLTRTLRDNRSKLSCVRLQPALSSPSVSPLPSLSPSLASYSLHCHRLLKGLPASNHAPHQP